MAERGGWQTHRSLKPHVGAQDSSELGAGTMIKERTVEPHLMGAAVPWPQEGVQASQSALLHDPEMSLIWAATRCQVVTA